MTAFTILMCVVIAGQLWLAITGVMAGEYDVAGALFVFMALASIAFYLGLK